MSVRELIDISVRYGSDSRYVIAGGGNTSWKTDEHMYVKGSGTELANAAEESFVKIDLKKLHTIWKKNYSDDPDAREEEVLSDLMDSRCRSEKLKRPSVETLLHAMLPGRFVVHTHPALVNGITCSLLGEEVVSEMFGRSAIWVPVVNPGYVLAKTVREQIGEQLDQGRGYPSMIFLQNHGVFVQGDSTAEIDRLYDSLFSRIKSRIQREPAQGYRTPRQEDADQIMTAIKAVLGEDQKILAFANADILGMSASPDQFRPLSLSFTPDHIVYYGHKPLYCAERKNLKEELEAFIRENSSRPRLAVVRDLGAFAFSGTLSAAEKARDLFLDDVKIAVYAESFGGSQFMPDDKIDFIRNWEAEKYRVSAAR